MSSGIARPPVPTALEDYDRMNEQAARLAIDRRLRQLETPASQGWSVTGLTPDRAFDASAAAAAEVRAVLGTLIEDLKAKGVIG